MTPAGGIFILGLVFLIFVAPFWVIMHYMTKWKATKGLTVEEQRMLEALWNDSERLEGRISAIETILDLRPPSEGSREAHRGRGFE